MLILIRWWREILIVALLTALCWPRSQPVASEKIVYKDRIVTVAKNVDTQQRRIVTKPDGTSTVTETHIVDKSGIKSTTTEKIKENKRLDKTDVYRYSATIALKYNDLKAVVVDVGARIGNLPVQGVVSYDTQTHAPRLGLRFDF